MEKIIGHSYLDQFFDETTMSLHIKQDRPILLKKGGPGNWKPVVDKSKVFDLKAMQDLVDKIYKEVEERPDGFIEIDKPLSKIIQLGPYRIVIVISPLADAMEMTIVKPVKRLTLKDYDLDKEIVELFRNSSKGILVSGAPGSGKTTFAQALVDLYHQDNNIIKTLESPRDLQVSDDVVQYSFTYGSHDELRDILLLSRPDFTVYDEVRNKTDFELYKDLRLTGIGLIGVIHATRPVDSIQRFLGTIEMGIIPQVIDTVIFIDKGKVAEILQLELTVKVPAGMQSADLARPVILVTSFLTKEVVYEIYSFGEQIVVMPIQETIGHVNTTTSKVAEYAEETVKKKLNKLIPCSFLSKIKGSNDINLYVAKSCKPTVIGRSGKKIAEIEEKLGLRIHVKLFDELPIIDTDIDTRIKNKKGLMSIQLSTDYADTKVCILANDELYFLTANPEGKVIVKDAKLIKTLAKKGFLIIDQGKL